MSLPLRDKPHLMQKLERTFNGALYRDAIKTSSNYNTRLINERAIRLPFIDLQTGVAQNNCSLWMRRWERMPGYNQGQIYSYPNRRWRKVKRTYLLNNLYSSKVSLESNVDEKSEVIGESSEFGIDSCLIDIPIKTENVDSSEKSEVSKEPSSRDPEEMLPDVLDFGEVDDPDTEEDEDYVSEIKRKTRKKHSKRKKASEYTDAEKPFVCDLCGIKYKTRPGLSYHYAHTHAFVNGDGGLSGGDNNQINYNNLSRGTIGVDDSGENTRSFLIIPSHSLSENFHSQPTLDYQRHIDNFSKRETLLREKISSTSSLMYQRSLNIPYQTNQQPDFGSPPKYFAISKSSTPTNPDEGVFAMSSNCRNALWPLCDPLFMSA